jgi:hypothetical protein
VFDELFKKVSETETYLVISKNYWAKFCKQTVFMNLLHEKKQHKMIPITLNISDTGSLKELNVNAAIHIKGSKTEE